MTHPASSTPAGPPAETTRRVDLDVTGMTCASCVGRVERNWASSRASRRP